MIILPAIDILNGNCVRLQKGEYDSAHKVAADAIETAKAFEADGAEYIHVVDLNGAKDGEKINNELICRIASSVNVPIEVGGGIRRFEDVEYYLERGVSRVIIGSAAYTNPELVKRSADKYGARIAVGIDARGGKVSTQGWTQTSDIGYTEFAVEMEKLGIGNVIFTEIERDGMLSGIDADKYAALMSAVKLDITASGGIKDIEDIKALMAIGVYGAICGKSIYSGSLSLPQAIKCAKEAIGDKK